MKVPILPALGILFVVGSVATMAAESKTATPEKVNPKLISEEPYRFNGVVTVPDGHGSGFCAWNRHTFFSAAHVVFSGNQWGVPPIWYPAANDQELDVSSAIQSRGYYRWTEYAALATAIDPDQNDFSKDVILAFAFKKLIPGKPAKLNLHGSSDLQRKAKSMITGYPAVNAYHDKNINGYFLHKTGPVVTPYKPFSGDALFSRLVTTGPGNSGGPIWTRNSVDGWNAAGVLVGGRPSESLVYSFSDAIGYLTQAVTPVIRPKIHAPVLGSDVSSYSIFYPNYQAQKIPDGRLDWTSFGITIDDLPNTTALLKSVKLSLDIRTPHRGDLFVILEGPGGYQAMIHNEEGAGRDNLIIKNMDLSESFAGISPRGDWYLRVQDRLVHDRATFKSFVLEIRVEDDVSAPAQ